jgi:hypothetical protein
MSAFGVKGSRPPFVDPEGKVFDTNNPTTSGFLYKQSAWLAQWRRRFFILKGSHLFFASDETTAPHGMIDLSKCQTVKSAEIKAGKKNAIEVSTQDTTFYMYADNEKDKDEWIGAIGRSIVQSSRTYQKDDGGDGEDSENSDD